MRRNPDRGSPAGAPVAAWIAAVVLALSLGIHPAQAKRPTEPRGPAKKELRMQFPSYEQLPMSPQLDRPGVKVLLGAASFKANEPVALYGSYCADAAFLAKCQHEPDTWITVTAIARDIPGVWSNAVLTKPSLAPLPPSGPPPASDSPFREYGFFNLDLRGHLQLPEQPSRYWLIVSMGDWKTEILSFELTK
jgi:hypothetical protein